MNSLNITELKLQWKSLHDLDRARAVHAIHQNGTSLRKLAKALDCSLTLLRHLLKALQATPEDRALARQRKISTSKLVRRSKATEAQRAAKDREALERKRTQAANKGCEVICDWLEKERLSGVYGEQVINEAWRELVNAEQSGKLPPHTAPPDTPTADIIERMRPPELTRSASSRGMQPG
jgi:transposase